MTCYTTEKGRAQYLKHSKYIAARFCQPKGSFSTSETPNHCGSSGIAHQSCRLRPIAFCKSTSFTRLTSFWMALWLSASSTMSLQFVCKRPDLLQITTYVSSCIAWQRSMVSVEVLALGELLRPKACEGKQTWGRSCRWGRESHPSSLQHRFKVEKFHLCDRMQGATNGATFANALLSITE